MSDEVMLAARVPRELKQLVDADRRTNEQILTAALWNEFGGERVSSLERRIEQKQQRISLIESEKNERERELTEAQNQLENLKTKLETMESRREREEMEIVEVARQLAETPEHQLAVDEPPVSSRAEGLGIEPAELLDRIMELKNER